jgi:hypothetical protein
MSFHSPFRRLPVPASCRGLDLAAVERALVKHQANVSAAARELGVPSGDLRKLTWSHPRLIDIALEEGERLIDRAEANIRRAVHDDAHPDRALQASIYVLSRYRAARDRGWSRSSAAGSLQRLQRRSAVADDQGLLARRCAWLSSAFTGCAGGTNAAGFGGVAASGSRDVDAPDDGRVH